jgi:hypothetical protein
LSPILLRPSREQDEHDRLARFLEAKYSKKKLEVHVNVRDEEIMPVKFGALTRYPDLVLGESKKLAGVVEIETGESVNNLEALAQWVHFGKARVPFHLYVPANMYEATRRLCDTYRARVTEIWTYRGAVDGFDLVRMYVDSQAKFPKPSTTLKPAPPKPVIIPPPPPPPPPVPVRPEPKAPGKRGGKMPPVAAGKSPAPVAAGRAAAPVAAGKGAAPAAVEKPGLARPLAGAKPVDGRKQVAASPKPAVAPPKVVAVGKAPAKPAVKVPQPKAAPRMPQAKPAPVTKPAAAAKARVKPAKAKARPKTTAPVRRAAKAPTRKSKKR